MFDIALLETKQKEPQQQNNTKNESKKKTYKAVIHLPCFHYTIGG